MPLLRDTTEVEALITDRYLESLLASRAGAGASAADAAFGWEGGELDRGVRVASLRLRRDLPRFHPSFRFEERLALRLAEASASMRIARAAGAEGSPVPLAARRPGLAALSTHDPDLDELVAMAGMDADPASDGPTGTDADPLRRHARPILIGGAVASAAVSIAGAAFVAWRRSHQPRSPMARAVQAAHAAAAGRAPGRPD